MHTAELMGMISALHHAEPGHWNLFWMPPSFAQLMPHWPVACSGYWTGSAVVGRAVLVALLP